MIEPWAIMAIGGMAAAVAIAHWLTRRNERSIEQLRIKLRDDTLLGKTSQTQGASVGELSENLLDPIQCPPEKLFESQQHLFVSAADIFIAESILKLTKTMSEEELSRTWTARLEQLSPEQLRGLSQKILEQAMGGVLRSLLRETQERQ